MKPGACRSVSTLWTSVLTLSQAYSRPVEADPAVANRSVRLVSSQLVCPSATSLPSCSAPSCRWCRVSARNVRRVNPCLREATSFTGRPSRLAASATSAVLCPSSPLDPNAPPTNGEKTRTCAGLIPSCFASPCWYPRTLWLDSHTVS